MVNSVVKLAVVHRHKMKAIQFDRTFTVYHERFMNLTKTAIFKPTYNDFFKIKNFRPMKTIFQKIYNHFFCENGPFERQTVKYMKSDD